jgi:hypothetical protein
MEEEEKLLRELIAQDYPLSIDQETARALVSCISRIMDLVPDDDRVLVRGDYNLVTSALCHPEGDLPRTNQRV